MTPTQFAYQFGIAMGTLSRALDEKTKPYEKDKLVKEAYELLISCSAYFYESAYINKDKDALK
jgi:hypothetical protein